MTPRQQPTECNRCGDPLYLHFDKEHCLRKSLVPNPHWDAGGTPVDEVMAAAIRAEDAQQAMDDAEAEIVEEDG